MLRLAGMPPFRFVFLSVLPLWQLVSLFIPGTPATIPIGCPARAELHSPLADSVLMVKHNASRDKVSRLASNLSTP